jgi:hypothetical protein
MRSTSSCLGDWTFAKAYESLEGYVTSAFVLTYLWIAKEMELARRLCYDLGKESSTTLHAFQTLSQAWLR